MHSLANNSEYVYSKYEVSNSGSVSWPIFKLTSLLQVETGMKPPAIFPHWSAPWLPGGPPAQRWWFPWTLSPAIHVSGDIYKQQQKKPAFELIMICYHLIINFHFTNWLFQTLSLLAYPFKVPSKQQAISYLLEHEEVIPPPVLPVEHGSLSQCSHTYQHCFPFPTLMISLYTPNGFIINS